MSGSIGARLTGWQDRQPSRATTGIVPYVLLAVLTAMSFKLGAVSATSHDVTLGVCILAALWMLFMHALLPAPRRAACQPVFVAGLIAITAVMVVRQSWFGFFGAVSYGYARELPSLRSQLSAAGALGVIGALSQTEDGKTSLLLHLIRFGVALAIDLLLVFGLTWLLWERERRIEQHKKALAELGDANLRLEATIAENEDLHQRLLVHAREAGTREERQRMAREIHDTLAQGLTGIVTQLQAAEQAADDPAGWRRHLAAATHLARESLAEARRSVHALRPEPLETGRLSEALAGVAARWSALNGIPVQVTTTGTARAIAPEAEFALLRAGQEALANVARHAHATRVGVTVSYMENEVAVDVRDDGVGFDPADSGRDGFGLVAMRQRIAALSGTLQVESEPGGGTAISACVPAIPALADT